MADLHDDDDVKEKDAPNGKRDVLTGDTKQRRQAEYNSGGETCKAPDGEEVSDETDFITVLYTPDHRLAKRINADGSVDAYDAAARLFDLYEMPVDGFGPLWDLVRRLLANPHACVVRGQIADPARVRNVRRLLHPDLQVGYQPTLKAAAHCWLALDMDLMERPDDVSASDLEACARLAISQLPHEFHGARCLAVATGSHGLKPGIRLRLWFWLNQPVTDSELKRWFAKTATDQAVFNPVQIIYTAAPVRAAGVADHLPRRMVVLAGRDAVAVPRLAQVDAPNRPPPAGGGDESDDIWLIRLIRKQRLRVREAVEPPPGAVGDVKGRNQHLFAAARTIGGVAEQAGWHDAEITTALLDDVRHQRFPLKLCDARATIQSGLNLGRQAPLKREI